MNAKLKANCWSMLLLGLSISLFGCVSQDIESGTKISHDKVAQIKKGVTTRAEVEQLLGPPANVTIMPEGKRQLTYSYMSTKTDAHATAASFIPYVGLVAGGAKAENQTRTQSLQVLINADGVVEDYEFNDNTSTTQSNTSGGVIAPSTSTTTNTSGTATTADDKK